MKHMKIILTIVISFAFMYTNLKADDTFDLSDVDIKCDEAKTQETISKCHATIDYCWGQDNRESAEFTGCFFNKKDPLYATTTLDADSWPFSNGEFYGKPVNDSSFKDSNGNTVSDANFKDSLFYKGSPNDAWVNIYGMTFRIYNNIKFEKSYAAVVGEKNEVTSLGCYKGYAKVRKNHTANYLYGVEEANKYETIAFDVVPEACDYKKDPDCMGPVLIFKLFFPNSNEGCTMKMVKMILPTTFNTEQKYASTNLLKTSVAKQLWASDSYYDETDSGLIIPPRYIEFNKNYAKLRIDSKCTPKSSCKGNNCDFCYTDLNKLDYANIHSESEYGRHIAYSENTYGARNIYNTMLGLNASAERLDPDDAHCPLFFYVNPNLGNDFVNKYRVSNNEGDNKYEGKNYGLDTFLKDLFSEGSVYDNGNQYKGCISDDEENFKKMKKCFEDAEKSIMSKSCPADAEDFTKFIDSLKTLQTKCKNEYNNLYARFLMIEDNKVFDEQIKDAVRKKIDECYDKKCNITEDERTKINNELKKSTYSLCKDGCPTITHYEYSDSPNAQCWMCGVGNDAYYTWADSNNASGCHPESKPKEECFGTHEQQSCIKCMKNAYSAIGLDEEKIKCMDENWAAKEQQKMESDETIDEQSGEYTDETSKKNAERASDTYTHYSIGLNGNGFGSDGDDCKSFLGENISKIVKASFTILRIAGAIIAIVNAMMSLIPAVVSKNADALKKASKKCVTMGIVLAAIGILPSIIILIARIFGYDISCLM